MKLGLPVLCLETQNVRALKAQRNKTDKADALALLTRFKRKDKVKTWGLAIAKRPQGHRGRGAEACDDLVCDVDCGNSDGLEATVPTR